jgi:hypothetical protein
VSLNRLDCSGSLKRASGACSSPAQPSHARFFAPLRTGCVTWKATRSNGKNSFPSAPWRSDRYLQLKQFEIELILTDGTVYPTKGQIFAADRQISPTTGALRVKALFPNPGYALRPGQFARVGVKFDTKHDALLVPQRAVSELQGSYQVAVVDADNKIHIQPVRVGDRSGNMWIIEDGLHPSQRVVVEGTQKIREGLTVTTTNFVAQPMQSATAQPNK